MKNKSILQDEVESILRSDKRLCTKDGKIRKNKAIELALNLDENLIKALNKNEKTQKHFFIEIEKHIFTFDKDKFTDFLTNKEFLPGSYTKFSNKIGLAANGKKISENNEVVLGFPHKDCVLVGEMTKEDQKRDEVFLNTTLSPDEVDFLLDPKVFTNFKKYDKDGEHEVDKIDFTDNLIIRGNNLFALHSLLKKYRGQIKLIYIDPPFNTEKDSFKYNDRFTRSSWLTFMKNRLEILKNLLKKDGAILVHIDHHQSHYLKILMDEVFDEDNFRNEIIWSYRTGGIPESGKLPKKHDVIYLYARSDLFDFNLFKERQYLEKSFMGSLIDEKGRYFVDTNLRDTIEGVLKIIRNGKIEEFNLRPVLNMSSENIENFKSQKPEHLIHLFLEMFTEKNDFILDCFIGSGTTIATAHKTNRRYVGIEQMEYIKTKTIPRMIDVINGKNIGISEKIGWKGGGSFIYCELEKNNQHWVEKIQVAKTSEELTEIWDDMQEKAFLSYKVDIKKFNKNIKEFSQLSMEDKKKILFETLDMNQLYVNYSEIDDKIYNISEEDKKLNKQMQAE